jgi:cobalt transporter subunit CbtA
MLTRVLLAVLLCGMAAGLAMGVMQHFRLTPLILQAETFENAPAGHSHDTTTSQAPAQESASAEWAPQDETERTLYTFAASILASAGFAALLAGVALVSGRAITRKSGWLWGLCGFIAVSLAPAAGLAPELPGMPAADLFSRQLWWLFTIAATASALWLLAFKRESWAVALALALVIIPHIIGAPQPTEHESAVPAALASKFVGLSLGANAAMWLLIGILLGYVLPKTEAAEAG